MSVSAAPTPSTAAKRIKRKPLVAFSRFVSICESVREGSSTLTENALLQRNEIAQSDSYKATLNRTASWADMQRKIEEQTELEWKEKIQREQLGALRIRHLVFLHRTLLNAEWWRLARWTRKRIRA